MNINNVKICVIGLGYVGLPLACEFSKKYKTIGYDILKSRIKELNSFIDKTKEVESHDLKELLSQNLILTNKISKIKNYNVYIVTVPTPIDRFKKPDLHPLKTATELVGEVINKNDVVIFESTVFPGCTEEECVPILEKISGLKLNKGFYCGYSPERVNPGDKVNTLTKIIKVTSGSNEKASSFIDKLYKSIIVAGTHKAQSIKVAEASKAIENAQRDLNISFVNELSIMFDKMGIDTNDVIDAASSKWNFLSFKPGLVGGHCISVDPYYLTYKAESLGYYPEVILSGRRVNDRMPEFIASKIIKLLVNKGIKVKGASCLIMGVTFKENCPDLRNSKVFNIYRELKQFGLNVSCFDPYAISTEVKKHYNINLIYKLKKYDSILLCVSHKDFLSINFDKLKKSPESVIYDVKSFLSREIVDKRL